MIRKDLMYMKILLTQQVGIEGDRFPHNWRKEYDSTVIPNIGMSVEDYCYVALEKYEVEIPNARKDEFAHMANLHGWACSWTQYKI